MAQLNKPLGDKLKELENRPSSRGITSCPGDAAIEEHCKGTGSICSHYKLKRVQLQDQEVK